jgi:hypothetical protein
VTHAFRTLASITLTALAPLALAAQGAAAPTAAATAPAAAPAALPAARELLDRYVAAIGGRDALMKHGSRRATGTLEIPAVGIKGEMVASAAKPDRMLVTVTLPGLGEMRQGFDGAVGWSIDPTQGPMVLSGKQLEQRRVQADFYGDLHETKSFRSMTTLDLVDFEGAKAYRVKLVRQSGDSLVELFDATSGLMVGTISTQESPMGALTITSVVSDYKPFGSVRMPTRITQKFPTGQQVTVTVTDVEFDAVPPAVFDLPAEIRALAGPGGK